MEYRVLGKTSLKVSALSFGASSLGGVFRPVEEAEGIRTVHAALDLGINYIDVAPYYGLTKAETVLGKALKDIPRGRFYLATKVGRYGADQFDFSAQRTMASVDESLKRLKVDYVDVIQCHDVEFGSLDQIVDETLPSLERLRDAGKVRFIGITGLPLKCFKILLDRAEFNTILSYCHYSLNDSALETMIPYFKEKNVGIISASPLSMGLLSDRGAPNWHPASPEIRQACAKAAQHCYAKGSDIAKLAVQFSAANLDIATTIVGTANSENIQKNIQWIEEPMDEELLAEVNAILAPIHNRTWPSGLPENN
ncbi:MAG: aldo/keto reductase [Candidatus Omnitrophota bacterium]